MITWGVWDSPLPNSTVYIDDADWGSWDDLAWPNVKDGGYLMHWDDPFRGHMLEVFPRESGNKRYQRWWT